MPWSKLDDNFYDHPKTVEVGTLGAGLYALCLSYTARQLTDGFIAKAMIKRLISDVDDPIALAELLVQAGLFEKVEGGYQIHDYLEYNPSGEAVLKDRAEARQRMAEVRQRQARGQDGQYQEPTPTTETPAESTTDEAVSEPVEKLAECSPEVQANKIGSYTVPVPVPHNIIHAPVGELRPPIPRDKSSPTRKHIPWIDESCTGQSG